MKPGWRGKRLSQLLPYMQGESWTQEKMQANLDMDETQADLLVIKQKLGKLKAEIVRTLVGPVVSDSMIHNLMDLRDEIKDVMAEEVSLALILDRRSEAWHKRMDKEYQQRTDAKLRSAT